VTLSAGLTNAHSGTSPAQAEVINLTRNIKITASSSTLGGYLNFGATSVVNIQYVEISFMGSSTTNKRGIDIGTTTGTFIFLYNSVHDFGVSSGVAANCTGTSGTTTSSLVISNNVYFTITGNVFVNVVSTGLFTYDSNVIIVLTNNSGFALANAAGVITNNRVSCGNGGFNLSTLTLGTFDSNVVHSCSGTAYSMVNFPAQTISNQTTWRCFAGVSLGGSKSIVLDNWLIFGHSFANVAPSTSAVDILLRNCTIAGDTSFSSPSGLNVNQCFNVALENCSLGVATGIYAAHTTSDVLIAGPTNTVILRNCVLGSSSEVSGLSNAGSTNVGVFSAKHDQTAGNHKFWMRHGTGTIDTAIYNTASPSLRLTPTTGGSNKLESALTQWGMTAAVSSGSTLTVTVAVRKSVSADTGGADYGGNQPRLIVRKNVAAGIAADTVLATAAAGGGVWETLSGTTAAVTDDAVLEFIVDCDGAQGWVNVDDWAVTPPFDSRAMKYWFEGAPYTSGNNLASGGAQLINGGKIS
jgi:hypothetical protein